MGSPQTVICFSPLSSCFFSILPTASIPLLPEELICHIHVISALIISAASASVHLLSELGSCQTGSVSRTISSCIFFWMQARH